MSQNKGHHGLSIAMVCSLPAMVMVALTLLSSSFFFHQFLVSETERFNRLSDEISENIAGEILIGDFSSIEVVTRRVKKIYGLEILTISDSPSECTFFQIVCVNKKIDGLGLEKYLFLVPDNTKLITIFKVIMLIILIAGISVIVVQIMLQKMLVSPIESVISSAEKSPLHLIDEIYSPGFYRVTEVRVIYEHLRRFAINLQAAISEKTKNEIESQKHEAIAKMTQMLAHDVRKPFTLINMSLDMISNLGSFEEIQEFLPKAKESIGKALTSINGMLEDVLELGRGSTLVKEDISPKQLVIDSLEEIAQMNQHSKMSLEYSWEHKHNCDVDAGKVKRIFSNIIGNAHQATRGMTRLWVKSRDVGEFVEFRIGNTNSSIPNEDCEKLFDAFYTKNKKGGTGLGLAIAKKVVLAHGGSIAIANSDKGEKYVEFTFKLPKATSLDNTLRTSLPLHLKEFAPTHKKPQAAQTENQKQLIEELKKKLERGQASIKVAVLDDESLYLEGIAKIVDNTPLSNNFNFCVFTSAKDLFNTDVDYDLIITDIDLSDVDVNGWDVVGLLRSKYSFSGAICVHSNKASVQDYEAAIAVGASAFIPKPMSLDHFLKLTIETIKRS